MPRSDEDARIITNEAERRPGDIWVSRASGLEFAWIPAGEFDMGSLDGSDDEKPVHHVRITRGFWMGKYAVTQRDWQQWMGHNPSESDSGRHPVEKVSWEDAREFLRRLSAQGEGMFRLPSEAEWEYACRAGSKGKWCYGDDEGRLGEYAWFAGNAGDSPHEVGLKRPSIWGLYDMHGNVREWCEDWYGEYPAGPVTDPKGPASGGHKVVRGGSWYSQAGDTRSAFRYGGTPDFRNYHFGFRCVREQ
jgi:formylglycine-generating enzyme required for sulfatase activity